jgi:hypothetical protein
MIPNFTTNNTYSPAEKFVAEKLIELVFTKTIDSHRVRTNNPFTAITEVKQVLSDLQAKKIKSFEKTVKPVIEEAFKLIKDDKTLQYQRINELYYSNLLRNGSEKEHLQLYYATNLVLDDMATLKGTYIVCSLVLSAILLHSPLTMPLLL